MKKSNPLFPRTVPIRQTAPLDCTFTNTVPFQEFLQTQKVSSVIEVPHVASQWANQSFEETQNHDSYKRILSPQCDDCSEKFSSYKSSPRYCKGCKENRIMNHENRTLNHTRCPLRERPPSTSHSRKISQTSLPVSTPDFTYPPHADLDIFSGRTTQRECRDHHRGQNFLQTEVVRGISDLAFQENKSAKKEPRKGRKASKKPKLKMNSRSPSLAQRAASSRKLSFKVQQSNTLHRENFSARRGSKISQPSTSAASVISCPQYPIKFYEEISFPRQHYDPRILESIRKNSTVSRPEEYCHSRRGKLFDLIWKIYLRNSFHVLRDGVWASMKEQIMRISKESGTLRANCLKLVEQNEMLKKGLEEIDTYAQRSKFAVGRVNHLVRGFRAKKLKLVIFTHLKQTLRGKRNQKQKAALRIEMKKLKKKAEIWREWTKSVKTQKQFKQKMFEKLKLKYLKMPFRMIKINAEVNQQKRHKLTGTRRKLDLMQKKRIMTALKNETRESALYLPRVMRIFKMLRNKAKQTFLREWKMNASKKTKITLILMKSLKKCQIIKKRHSLSCWKNVIVFENQSYLQTRLKLMPRQVEEKLRSLYCRELQRALKRQKQNLVRISSNQIQESSCSEISREQTLEVKTQNFMQEMRVLFSQMMASLNQKIQDTSCITHQSKSPLTPKGNFSFAKENLSPIEASPHKIEDLEVYRKRLDFYKTQMTKQD